MERSARVDASTALGRASAWPPTRGCRQQTAASGYLMDNSKRTDTRVVVQKTTALPTHLSSHAQPQLEESMGKRWDVANGVQPTAQVGVGCPATAGLKKQQEAFVQSARLVRDKAVLDVKTSHVAHASPHSQAQQGENGSGESVCVRCTVRMGRGPVFVCPMSRNDQAPGARHQAPALTCWQQPRPRG